MLERTLPVSPQISFTSDESGICDTIFYLLALLKEWKIDLCLL